MINEIPINEFCADCSLASAALCLVFISREPLCESLSGDIYYNIFLLYEILRRCIIELLLYDLGSPSVSIILTDCNDLIADNTENLSLIREKILVICYLGFKIRKLVENLIGFKMREPSKLHIDDGIGLNLIEIEGFLKLK